MEVIYKLEKNLSATEVIVVEWQLRHSDHQWCEVCGSKMHFEIQPRAKPYSGWTRNLVYDLVEVCKNECECFKVLEVFRNRKDGRLYSTNFEDLDERIQYILNNNQRKNQND